MGKIHAKTVEFRNFFSYGNSWTTVNFNEGINVVLGQDLDKERSNGAGKTSFLETIPFALFGQTSKGVSQNKIINWKNGKQCEVRFTFEKDGIEYIIHRGIKPGKFELIKDGSPVPKLSDKRLFQQELESDIIGMDFKSAQAFLFQNANNTVSLFNTPKAEKRRFIEKLFNLEIYSQLNEVVNAKIRTLDQKIKEIELETEFKRNRLKELRESIDNCISPDIVEYENSYNTAVEIVTKFELDNESILTFDIETLETEVQHHKNERDSYVMLRDEITAERSEQESSVSELKGEEKQIQNRIATIGDLSAQIETKKKLEEALSKIPDVDSQIEELESVLDAHNKVMDEASTKLTEYRTQIKQVRKELGVWQEKSLEVDPECPTCFQTTDPEHIKSHVAEKIDSFKTALEGLNKVDEAQEIVFSGAKQESIVVKEKIATLRKLGQKKQEIETRIASMSDLDDKEHELALLNERLCEITDSLQWLGDRINEKSEKFNETVDMMTEHSQQIEKLIKEKDALVSVRQRVEVLKKDVDVAQKILEEKRIIVDDINKEQEARIASVAQIESELSEYDGSIKSTTTMKEYLSFIKETLKDENVKQYAIGNIIPFLERQTNHYLSETGHSYYIKLDNWIDGEIMGSGVGDCDFGNMSGGEGKSIDLALKFAMMDVARMQAGSYLDILVLDELLDSSIDSYGLEKLMDIVRLKQNEDDLKVFVVSHREELSEFDPDFVYKVTKQNGFSNIGLV